MDSRLVLARRELASLRREKTIVLALAIQLFVAAFSSVLVVGLVSLYAPGSAGGALAVTVGVTGDAGGDLAPVVDEGDALHAIRYDSAAAARSGFRHGEVDASSSPTACRTAGRTSTRPSPTGPSRRRWSSAD
ncbi:hypothetical protein [Halarchaeum acidiphilum]|uniref:hypothetical protein n=1 Tax=Halarchaeum acidiphilum TaxID=489138 RepID=UPI000AD2442C|nr:hypothetical protein [Halarchaeum acidiphilum]